MTVRRERCLLINTDNVRCERLQLMQLYERTITTTSLPPSFFQWTKCHRQRQRNARYA